MATPSTPRQQSIAGLEPDNPEIAAAIEAWLEAVESAKAAAERKTYHDDAVTSLMIARGVPYYPYTDPSTGKRKYRIVDTSPRGRSVANRGEVPAGAEVDEADLSESEPAPARESEEVTHRRVPRARVDAELAAIAEETRRADDAVAGGGSDAAVDGALRAGRSPYEEDDVELEQKPPEREDLLELYEKPTSPAERVDAAAAAVSNWDAEACARGECGLRFEREGVGCARAVGHEGLHEREGHRWKQRKPKEHRPQAGEASADQGVTR